MSVEIFSFGACLLSAPANEIIRSNRATGSWSRHSKTSGPAVYTLDEALQIVRFMRGDLDIPPLFRNLCCLDRNEDGRTLKACFDSADVVLIEVNSPVAIRYSQFALCRSVIIGSVLAPLRQISTDMARMTNAWYNQAMMAENSEVREKIAQVLARAVTDDMPDADLARAVLVDARPYRRGLAALVEGLAELRDAFRAPLGVMTYTHQYMPDGRPLPWPADFVDQTIAAAQKLDLPVFKPSEFVAKYGPKRALMPDWAHYQPEFAVALGDSLWEFIENLTNATLMAGPGGTGAELAATHKAA